MTISPLPVLRRLPFLLLLVSPCFLAGREFTVLVYNVENLFDVDGVALFEDYRQPPEGEYGTGPLLNKLEGIRRIVAAFNDGAGPDIILFNELELDRTPYDRPEAERFLAENSNRSLRELLEKRDWARDLPAELLLLKYLEDHDIRGYRAAVPDPRRMEVHKPHHNIVFSRFPVTFIRQRALFEARDLLVVGVEVEGHPFILLNNHWKSGASNPSSEPIRVQNARVVRAEIEALLLEDPLADVLIAGDFNAYYNHKAVFPDLPETSVNDVLRSNGFEARMVEDDSASLYNLWYELPPEQRGSEIWRGTWGTLMQMILTPGLYDRRGIQYVDNSFGRLLIPGENADERWNRPVRWTAYGGGAGYSDHLPVYARFRVIKGRGSRGPMELDNPSNEALSAFQPKPDFTDFDRSDVPDISELADLSPLERARRIRDLFWVDLPLVPNDRPAVQVGDLVLDFYSPFQEVRELLEGLQTGDRLRAYADLDTWRGRLQLVIRHPDWVELGN